MFFQSDDAKECRFRVQNMNRLKHEVKNEVDVNRINDENNGFPKQVNSNDESGEVSKVKISKWAKYLSDDDN